MEKRTGLKAYEKLLIVISILGMMGMASLMSQSDSLIARLVSRKGKGRSVGSVIETNNDVRRRLRTSFSWYPSNVDDLLYEYDSVFTGHASEAYLNLMDESTIKVLENSLVVLQMKRNELLLSLQGGASINLVKGSEVKIASREKVIRIGPAVKNENVAVQSTADGSLRISTKANKLRIKLDNQERELSKDQILYLDKSQKIQIRQKKVKLISPEKGQIVWRAEKKNSVDFSYKIKNYTKKFRIQVSQDLKFETLIFEAPLNENSPLAAEILDLKEGQYHWKVIDGSKDDATSMSNSFTIARIAPVALMFPADGTEITTESKGAERIRFRWHNKLGVEHYNIQVTDKENTVVANKTVKSTQFVSGALSPGEYSWQIRPADKTPVYGLWSDKAKFYLNKKKPEVLIDHLASQTSRSWALGPERMPMEPAYSPANNIPKVAKPQTLRVLKFPTDSRREPTSEVAAINPPELKWLPVESAGPYEVQVSDDPNFKNIVWTDKTNNTKILWPGVRSGKFYWRVRGKDGQFSTPPGTIKAFLPPPKLPDGDLEVTHSYDTLKILNDSPAKVKLEWSPIPTAKGYRIHVSKNEDFVGDTRKFRTRKPQAEIDLEKEGVFFAKVTALGRKGQKYSQTSPPKKIKLTKNLTLQSPGVLGPQNATSVVAFDLKNAEPLAFLWKKVKEADEYELVFSSDSNFKTITAEKRFKKNQYILNVVSEGKTYWRVRSRRGRYISEWSKTYFFDVQVPK